MERYGYVVVRESLRCLYSKSRNTMINALANDLPGLPSLNLKSSYIILTYPHNQLFLLLFSKVNNKNQ